MPYLAPQPGHDVKHRFEKHDLEMSSDEGCRDKMQDRSRSRHILASLLVPFRQDLRQLLQVISSPDTADRRVSAAQRHSTSSGTRRVAQIAQQRCLTKQKTSIAQDAHGRRRPHTVTA